MSKQTSAPGWCVRRFAIDRAEVPTWTCVDHDPDTEMAAGTVTVAGPPDTPYMGKTFVVRCGVPTNYPLHPPTLAFETPIWHPNIELTQGAVCMNILKPTEWHPVVTLANLLHVYLDQLLRYPAPEDPYNIDAAAMALRDPSAFAAHASTFTG